MARIEVDDRLAERIVSAIEDFDSISTELRRVNKKLDRVLWNEVQESVDLAALTTQIAGITSFDESMKGVIDALADKIEAAISDPVKLQALSDELRTSRDALVEAVKANTV